MKILVLSNEVWNDKINGNNVTSNWFEGMEAEFANIYASPGEPFNRCCSKYFQITDYMMLYSLLRFVPAGKTIQTAETGMVEKSLNAEPESPKIYAFLKSISGDALRLLREILWLLGRYNVTEMKKFIDEFQPDVIFTERKASCKMLRLEKIVMSMTKAPMFAFTGDDEFSLRQLKLSPFFWINRIMIRRRLRKIVNKYKIYYTLSQEQKNDYENRFHCRCKILQKCGEFTTPYTKRKDSDPIQIIYAGKFYCNRWKVLGEIVDALREINKDGTKMVLKIYTRDTPTKRQNRLLNDQINSFICGGVSQEELNRLYKQFDIALHVESQDRKNRLETRLSFSTKIIDCIFSGCAVLAYCWDQQSGWTYLKREDAALCVSNNRDLKKALQSIVENQDIINIYREKSYNCGIRNHQRKNVQEMLLHDFRSFVNCEGEKHDLFV